MLQDFEWIQISPVCFLESSRRDADLKSFKVETLPVSFGTSDRLLGFDKGAFAAAASHATRTGPARGRSEHDGASVVLGLARQPSLCRERPEIASEVASRRLLGPGALSGTSHRAQARAEVLRALATLTDISDSG